MMDKSYYHPVQTRLREKTRADRCSDLGRLEIEKGTSSSRVSLPLAITMPHLDHSNVIVCRVLTRKHSVNFIARAVNHIIAVNSHSVSFSNGHAYSQTAPVSCKTRLVSS